MFNVECVMEKLLVYRRENDTSVDFDCRQLENRNGWDTQTPELRWSIMPISRLNTTRILTDFLWAWQGGWGREREEVEVAVKQIRR